VPLPPGGAPGCPLPRALPRARTKRCCSGSESVKANKPGRGLPAESSPEPPSQSELGGHPDDFGERSGSAAFARSRFRSGPMRSLAVSELGAWTIAVSEVVPKMTVPLHTCCSFPLSTRLRCVLPPLQTAATTTTNGSSVSSALVKLSGSVAGISSIKIQQRPGAASVAKRDPPRAAQRAAQQAAQSKSSSV